MSNVKDARPDRIKITLSDGVERELKFTLNAMATLEERYGSVEDAFAKLEGNSIIALRCILWAGLVSSDPNLTEQQVGDLIDMQDLGAITEKLGGAFESNMPTPETAEADTPKA